jgi:hypothetical protein
MIDLLKRAVEQAAQFPEDKRRHIAEIILAEIAPEQRWKELLSDPRSEKVLEELVVRAKQQKPLPCPQPRGEE